MARLVSWIGGLAAACAAPQTQDRSTEVGVYRDAGMPAATGGRPLSALDNAAGPGARAAGSSAATGNALRVRIEDLKGVTVEIVTLKCGGECADVLAVARGGNPPYAFTWDDGSTNAQRHVCAKTKTDWVVTATDTAIVNDEFAYAAQTAQGRVSTELLACDAPGMPGKACDARAAPGSFDPVVKWRWTAGGSAVTPLVGNLTDDNGDGLIDLNDTPDILVTDTDGTLVVLDGRTGSEHRRLPAAASGAATPALADLDGDHKLDIVAQSGGTLAALHADGKRLWSVSVAAPFGQGAIAIADLDHDGSPEILVGGAVLDAKGKLLWSGDGSESPTAADLDDDGYLEVIYGPSAYRHDGTPYYTNMDVAGSRARRGIYTAVANLEGDDRPEIVVNGTGLFVLDHQGKTLHALAAQALGFPPAIHDLDGDGVAEILVSDGAKLTAYSGALSVRWSMPVSDVSGIAAGTAFDFLGDGSAEAMYGDEQTSWVFDGIDGHVVFMEPRQSRTWIEYPTVADVDNDGSADVLIVSDSFFGASSSPGLQVISDRMGRWIPARRIMNQDTYHVTNVNEDGSIPAHEAPHWRLNNSFRAQGQVGSDGTWCVPRR